MLFYGRPDIVSPKYRAVLYPDAIAAISGDVGNVESHRAVREGKDSMSGIVADGRGGTETFQQHHALHKHRDPVVPVVAYGVVLQEHPRLIRDNKTRTVGIVADGIILRVDVGVRSPQPIKNLRILYGVARQPTNGVASTVDTAVDGESVQREAIGVDHRQRLHCSLRRVANRGSFCTGLQGQVVETADQNIFHARPRHSNGVWPERLMGRFLGKLSQPAR